MATKKPWWTKSKSIMKMLKKGVDPREIRAIECPFCGEKSFAGLPMMSEDCESCGADLGVCIDEYYYLTRERGFRKWYEEWAA